MPIPGWAIREEEPPALDSTLNKYIVNDWIQSRTEIWGEQGLGDEGLFEDYQCDFDGWTADHFELAAFNTLKLLRKHLREWGVYMTTKDKGKKQLALALARLLEEEEPTKWIVATL
jgi:hypothetical protein